MSDCQDCQEPALYKFVMVTPYVTPPRRKNFPRERTGPRSRASFAYYCAACAEKRDAKEEFHEGSVRRVL